MRALLTLPLILFLAINALAFNSAIESIDFNADKMIVNNYYTAFIVITNDSNEIIQTTLRVFDNNQQFFSFSYEISGEADLNAAIPYLPITDKNHIILATIDLNDDNPLDNNLSKEIFVFKGADPAISGVFFPQIVTPNQKIQAQTFIQNVGDLTSGFFDLSAYLDSNKIFETLVNPLAQSEYAVFDINFVAPSEGEHVFKVIIDENNLLSEFSKINNQAEVFFSVESFEDRNLTREEIEEIIRQYFEQRASENKEALELCQQNLRLLDGNLQGCMATKIGCTEQFFSCDNSLSNCRSEHSTCTTNLSLASSNAKKECETDLQRQHSSDENFFRVQLFQKDLMVKNAEDSAKTKGDLNAVLALIIMIGGIGLAAYIVYMKRVP